MSLPSLVIHAHCYQPPREDPWTGEIPAQPAAAPWHDWNARIDAECYRPLGQADSGSEAINAYAWLSFNVGATLAAWLLREAPVTHDAMVTGDRAARERTGFGNAIAMPYHHVILPLASRRDKVTEVRWGIRDFMRRFGREPVGMWLPETAVDDETLDVLAQEGIRFTVLAPHQVARPPLHGLPGLVRTTGGHRITVFLYDGTLAHDIAFGPLLTDAAALAGRLQLPPDDVAGPRLVAVATDGETFGHHHAAGVQSLAGALGRVRTRMRVENFESVLARHPATEVVTLVAPSSWSCAHGVERWRSDCGCRIIAGTSQAWRAPLREALDWLGETLDGVYYERLDTAGRDPWAVLEAHCPGEPLDASVPEGLRPLQEMMRQRHRMMTSCAWFFDDIHGLEVPQALRFAVRAMELSGELDRLAPELGQRLEAAVGNPPWHARAADILLDILDSRVASSGGAPA